MRAGELCIRDVVTARDNETVTEVARRMAEYRVGDVIVIADRPHALPRPIGIITDRDLVVGVLARPDRSPASTTVGDILQRELVVATEDDDVESVVAKMRARDIRRIAIVDRGGGLQGILSLDDVFGWMRDQLDAATKLLEHQGRGPHFDLRAR